VKDLREVLEKARDDLAAGGLRTLLFVDEIHRFNKTQQDALLPWVERGDIVLIGATTENPSFELTSALLSRLRLFVLEPLQPDQVRTLLERALASDPALLELGVAFTPAALAALAELSEGDARQALGLLESLATIVAESPERRRAAIDRDDLDKLLQLRAVRYDKAGEEHFNLISALHKSLRNSDPDAAIYWLARMLAGGEDPLYIARRLVRFASEDVGLADPQALPQAVAARDAVRFIGLPEGALALTQAVVYLALAPKSNALYRAYQSAEREVQRGLNPPVPLHLRNAPTGMMRGLGYGRGYAYAHDDPEAAAAMSCLPDALAGRRFYTPRDRGFEKELADRLRALDAARRGARTQRADPSGASDPDSAGANIPGSTGANDSGRAPERRSDPQEASDETDRSADRRR
jgi:putative ATPase